MPRHSESHELCQHIVETENEFVAPIEQRLWSDWASGDDEVDRIR